MADEKTRLIDSLFRLLNEEKKSGELHTLPRDFYSSIEKELQNNAFTQTEQQNTRTTLDALKQKRRQKLLIYLAYDKTLPTPVPEEENRVYKEVLALLGAGTPTLKTAKIKIAIKIPEVITTTGNTIGPYQEGEIITVNDPSDAEFIINNKIGKKIEE